jgi:hypothetical protein
VNVLSLVDTLAPKSLASNALASKLSHDALVQKSSASDAPTSELSHPDTPAPQWLSASDAPTDSRNSVRVISQCRISSQTSQVVSQRCIRQAVAAIHQSGSQVVHQRRIRQIVVPSLFVSKVIFSPADLPTCLSHLDTSAPKSPFPGTCVDKLSHLRIGSRSDRRPKMPVNNYCR